MHVLKPKDTSRTRDYSEISYKSEHSAVLNVNIINSVYWTIAIGQKRNCHNALALIYSYLFCFACFCTYVFDRLRYSLRSFHDGCSDVRHESLIFNAKAIFERVDITRRKATTSLGPRAETIAFQPAVLFLDSRRSEFVGSD